MSTKANVAGYLGTFDPFTCGHLDVVERASKIFSKLIIGVGKNHRKKTLFNADERRDMLQEICKKFMNVEVKTFEGLAVEFAKVNQISVMVRGIRTEADYVYEMQMAMMNHILSDQIETIFIPTKQSLSHISSSLVKEVSALGVDVSSLVPPVIKQRLEKK